MYSYSLDKQASHINQFPTLFIIKGYLYLKRK